MQKSSTRNNNPETFIWLIIAILVSVSFVAMCSSCSPKTQIEYVDREVIKYEKQYVHDTTIIDTHDSIYQIIFQRGDTVYNTKYVEKIKYKDRVVVKADTCWKDSIRVEYKKETVEKRVTPKWCYYSLIGCGILILIVGFKIYKWWLKLQAKI